MKKTIEGDPAIEAFLAARQPGTLPHTRSVITFNHQEMWLTEDELNDLIRRRWEDQGWSSIEWDGRVLTLIRDSRTSPVTEQISWETSPLAGRRILFYHGPCGNAFDGDHAYSPNDVGGVGYAMPPGLDRQSIAERLLDLNPDLEGTGCLLEGLDIYSGGFDCDVFFTVEDEAKFLEWATALKTNAEPVKRFVVTLERRSKVTIIVTATSEDEAKARASGTPYEIPAWEEGRPVARWVVPYKENGHRPAQDYFQI